MTTIKICGLRHLKDIDMVNQARPDYAGFIIDFPKSLRNVTTGELAAFKARLHPKILAVGVFVDAPVDRMASLVKDGLIDVIQLHGHEDNGTIAALRRQVTCPVIKAFKLSRPGEIPTIEKSLADLVLLDSGAGSGKTFDWSLTAKITRPFMLAGGLTPDNIGRAVAQVHPRGVDLSSGVETGGVKDSAKVMAAVAAARMAS